MIFIYIQYIPLGAKTKNPFRLVLYSKDFDQDYRVFTIRPEQPIPKKIYTLYDLNRLELLASEPFCNSADELIDLFRDQELIFSERLQFDLLKSQFRNIGYNFNLKPIILWPSGKEGNRNLEQIKELVSERQPLNSLEYAEVFLDVMNNFKNQKSQQLEDYRNTDLKPQSHELSKYNKTPGVYFFLNEHDEVIYVGKAKNIRKRLQSHFSNTSTQSNIDYSQVENIDVIYTGNDIIAQLVETANIKSLKPSYNSQQILNPDPYIITSATTAKGISKIKITRKEFEDSLPEKYFNRKSVVESLADFCQEYNLCRKHSGLENVKGPCSNFTKKFKGCVCSGGESIEEYNKRFEIAFAQFRRKKTRKIYKLKGRNKSEDAFVYELNGIYEGYGYIEKSVPISSYNDILGHLIKQNNNYDTTRIISSLGIIVSKQDILYI
ncbi:GIY-YIG nuclease family protein [Gillisia sp. JM1]|uniref:GIY-YIG nuclease family protein n=1 Tax=Gillisia sp. JM1 TaxID=1283286 RepID=UPI0003F9DC78|nr:GIY-YIG nuclease family protein [Gillisia sp. JM1]